MLPRFGDLPFPTPYGLMVALALGVGLFLAGRRAERLGLSPRAVRDVLTWACLAGLLGAKLLLLVVEPALLREPWTLMAQGGVFYGGLIAAVLTMVALCPRRKLPLHVVGDACAPALALGHALGRVGCFLAGCCWGRVCSLPWAVRHVHPEAVATASMPGIPVHPVQLYEAAGHLITFLALLWLGRRHLVPGVLFWTYVASYSALRFTWETFRGDPRGSVLGGALSTSQAIAVAGAAVAGLMLGLLLRRSRRPVTSPGATEVTGEPS